MAKAQMTITLRVRLAVPAGANAPMIQNYVRDAIRTHCGGLDPKDEMFELDRASVTVSLLKKEVTYGK